MKKKDGFCVDENQIVYYIGLNERAFATTGRWIFRKGSYHSSGGDIAYRSKGEYPSSKERDNAIARIKKAML